MTSNIFKRQCCYQMVLAFDCLIPEEAKKILDCIWSEKMDAILCDNLCEVEYSYSICRNRDRYTRDSVIFIKLPRARVYEAEQDEQDRKDLESIRQLILDETKIKEEE